MPIPTATYRIQFSKAFDFQAASDIITYLADLGISCIYASPIFKARKGSLHGYDIVDPSRLNPELGSITDFEKLKAELQKQHMGWLQDIVPNHMAFDFENKMLMDVFENGRHSMYRHFFDVDWEHPLGSLQGKLPAPFLGGYYGQSLENKEIRLEYAETGFSVNYYDQALPLKIDSYTDVLTFRSSALRTRLGEDHPHFIKFLAVLHILNTLPSGNAVKDRCEQIKVAKYMLWELYCRNPVIRRFVDTNIEMFNGEKGNPESFRHIDKLLDEQVFRLSYWKVANEEINYRRFFHLNDFICLRMEDEAVFDRTHTLIFKLIEDGPVSGLRVDHIDGLYDPAIYLRRLRKKAGDIYLVVEKILDRTEDLVPLWPVQGTTGYEFMNTVNGLFCQSNNADRFSTIYASFSGFKNSATDLVYEQKKHIMAYHMKGDLDNLAGHMKRIAGRDRYGKDFTRHGLNRALKEILAHFPVYRTYINHHGSSPSDQRYIQTAAKAALRRHPGLRREIDYITSCLLAEPQAQPSPAEEDRIDFVLTFQQFTAPLMAKGFEDTLLYHYNRLISLNEVGGEPYHFGCSLDAFHAFNRKRAALWPHSLSATATHDAKRGEDVRARINVLSELPDEWHRNLETWKKLNSGKKKRVGGNIIPDGNGEYFLYQTLIGSFPFDKSDHPEYVERIKTYGIKALREANVHSNWLAPDIDYEEGFVAFIGEILDVVKENPFLERFLPFCRRIAHYGVFNSLSQTLIKITAPGLPDFYQGTELWDLNLVDPDNRRSVDFDQRKAYLKEIREKVRRNIHDTIEELRNAKEDGRIKLFLIHMALEARNRNREIFLNGNYTPLAINGRFKDNIIAFARFHINQWCLTIVPRFLTSVIKAGEYPLGSHVWFDTEVVLPDGFPYQWKNIFTAELLSGRSLRVSEILKDFPVAMLMSEDRP
ncbi:malto-oligosyltrehalose synthase [Desulfobacter latus]|uniref:Malto-oligosyltrehalose synthase n=1 Tax=Desulfobacter latus TaxID=2292 RepID=A0A850TAT6_9BACT|nr:malto-oligosyltrehalose synthase [Desulfobacter latus]NWH04486.1 malto-oligosyltrehalose synthase [Desulfobacter latus]